MEVFDGAQQVFEPISRSVIGRKFESAFDGGNGIGTESDCEAEKCFGLLCVAEDLNETLELISVSVWAAVDATIHQDAKLGR